MDRAFDILGTSGATGSASKMVTGAVIDADDGKPAIWVDDKFVGKVPLRFRTEALAHASADKLNAGRTRSHEHTPRTCLVQLVPDDPANGHR